MRHNFFIVANPGAGLSGSPLVDQVTAALRQAGASVVVLEGRSRVGGRVFTHVTADGTRVDLGGTWVGGGQDAVHSPAQRNLELLARAAPR